MGTWEYRVFRSRYSLEGGIETSYTVREFYYEPTGWSSPTWPVGETLDELRDDLKAMVRALDKPVIDAETGEELKDA